ESGHRGLCARGCLSARPYGSTARGGRGGGSGRADDGGSSPPPRAQCVGAARRGARVMAGVALARTTGLLPDSGVEPVGRNMAALVGAFRATGGGAGGD